MSNFGAWWSFVMLPQYDGSAADGPMTRWGWTYGTWCDAMGVPESGYALLEFNKITEAAAGALAETYFWDRLGGTYLNPGVDVSFVDWRWTSSGSTAFIQKALGCDPDGIVGPLTIKAMNAVPAATLVQDIHDWRRAYYDSIGLRSIYPGLYTRADACLALAKTLLTPASPVPVA